MSDACANAVTPCVDRERRDERLGVVAPAAISDRDVRAVFGEQLRDRGADAARAAGDERALCRGARSQRLLHDLADEMLDAEVQLLRAVGSRRRE